MDCAKVADFICPVLSAAEVNIEKFKADPHAFGGAYDELGLSTISILRAQGIGSTVPIIQDLAKVPGGKRKEVLSAHQVRDVFSLFLTSEFPDSSKVISLDEPNDLLKLALEFKNLAPLEMNYKQERGHMIVEGLEIATDVSSNQQGQHVDLWGVVNGSGFSSQEHLHLTGFGDLEIVGIGAAFCKATLETERNNREEREECMDEEKPKKHRKESGKKAAKRREDFVIFRSAEGVESFELKESNFDPNKIVDEKANKIDEDLNKLIEGFRDLDIPRNSKLEDEDKMDNEIVVEEAEEDDDISYEEYEQNRPLIKNQATIVQVQARPPEEREFEDEVEYPATVSLAEKFQDYRGMKSFRTSVWSKFVALADPGSHQPRHLEDPRLRKPPRHQKQRIQAPPEHARRLPGHVLPHQSPPRQQSSGLRRLHLEARSESTFDSLESLQVGAASVAVPPATEAAQRERSRSRLGQALRSAPGLQEVQSEHDLQQDLHPLRQSQVLSDRQQLRRHPPRLVLRTGLLPAKEGAGLLHPSRRLCEVSLAERPGGVPRPVPRDPAASDLDWIPHEGSG